MEFTMKKIFTALLLIASVAAASATERITILWGFSPGSNTANILRAVAKEANTQQSKYEFVVLDRQGAGGSVAANAVLQNPLTQLYAATGTFFIRPYFNKETGYDANRFQLAGVPASGAPIALYCKKYKNVAELLQTTSVTIADSGNGSMLNLINSVFTSQVKDARMVHYGTNYFQTLADVAGGHIDCAWHWVSDVEERVKTGNGYIVGITGLIAVQGFKTFKSQGISNLDRLTSNTGIFASNDMPAEKISEIRTLLASASKNKDVNGFIQREYSGSPELPITEYKKWFDSQHTLWKKIIKDFKK
jgi:tripartite-type tricarboxylate transporter receptor subunit TctC